MSRVDSQILVPPRLLAGAAVLFWGGLGENAIIGLVIALLLEAKNWMKVRWDFGETGHVKAYQLSLFLLAIGMLLIWIDGERRYGLLKIMQWTPLYALPIELAQRYGRQDSMYLNTFFYFSRKRMLQDRIEGREVDPMKINTGYPYIGLVLLSTACSASQSWTHVIGLIVLMLAVFISVSVRRGMSYWGVVLIAPLMILVGFTIQWGVVYLNNYLRNPQASSDSTMGGGRSDMSERHANIGALGKVKQSKEIMWRVWTGQDPSYLRVGTYDSYRDGRWTYNFHADGYTDSVDSFEKEGSITVGSGESLAEVYREEDQARGENLNPNQGARIRGTIDTKESTAVIPSISGYYAVNRILGDNVNSDNNPMGTLRLINREPIIDYMLWYELGHNVQDQIPQPKDYVVSKGEKKVIEKLAAKLDLKSYPTTHGKIAAIRTYFAKEFTYATHFEADYDYAQKTEVEIFLTEAKKGHCEYFATATVLLLREAGVPARYAVGFAMKEKEGDVWYVRGTHGHAWCRVLMDNGQWEDVDLTPPDWLGADSARVDMNWAQSFQQWIKLLREDFQVWRQDESNKGKFWMILTGIGALVGGWIAFRLWQSRLTGGEEDRYAWKGDMIDTPLHRLEKAAVKVLGQRPVGMPYGKWISGLAEIDEVNEQELDRAVALHQRLRFDPEADMDQQELEDLTVKVQAAVKSSPQKR